MIQPSFASRAMVLLTLLLGCGGSDGGNGLAPEVVVSVSPAGDTLTVGTSTTFSALVTGDSDGSVSWTILEGAVGGSVSAGGVYTAGATAGNFRIVATSSASPTSKDTVVAMVVNPPVIRQFRVLGTKAPAGGSGLLELTWEPGPGITASVEPGPSVLTYDSIFITTLAGPGPILLTASVRSLADSVVTETATITTVTPAAGGFQPTGSLVTARMSAAVVELGDGRILVAGGRTEQPGIGLTAAELYDPATGQFTATGSLGKARMDPQAVTLNDGRVLVMGFDDVQGPSTELYDTATGQFTPGPDASLPGASEIVLLADGRAFVITGGTTAELFDPVANTFTAAGDMSEVRHKPGVIPLPDGRILVAGGSATTKTAEIFDPATGLFSATDSMAQARLLGTFTRLADGRVLAAGGFDFPAFQFVPGGEVYDPATGVWSPVGLHALPRYDHTATLLDDGRVLLLAGTAAFYVAAPYAETFDPATGEFTPLLGTLGGGRLLPMTLRMSDGRLLIIGGMDGLPGVTSLVEIFQ